MQDLEVVVVVDGGEEVEGVAGGRRMPVMRVDGRTVERWMLKELSG